MAEIPSITEQADASVQVKKGERRLSGQTPPLDRLPPHSNEAEQGVIGCCLLDPSQCIDFLTNKFSKSSKLSFYDLRHQTVYAALVEMREKSLPIDLITVMQWLKDRQQLDQIGGIAYLSQLQDAVPSAANLDYYADIVLEKYLLRQYITVCTETVGKIFEYRGEVEALCDEIEKDILKINELKTADFVLPTPTDLTGKVIANIEAAWASNGEPTGISTGFHDLDNKTDGLHNGEMIVLAARPSIGKTALACNIVEHVAINLHKPVAVFSLEMTADQLIERMMASQAKVNIRAMKKDSMLGMADAPKLTSAAGKINAAPFLIDDTSGLSILQLRARARRMKKDHNIELIVIDYLQLLNSSTVSKSDNREREIADISQGIKAMAKELQVPVIVLSQLNRESEKTGGKPKLSQLRESGAIEQDADVVGLLYEAEGYDPNSQTEADAGQPINLFIAKQRNGERYVTVNFMFLKHFTRFEMAAPSHGIPESSYTPGNN